MLFIVTLLLVLMFYFYSGNAAYTVPKTNFPKGDNEVYIIIIIVQYVLDN